MHGTVLGQSGYSSSISDFLSHFDLEHSTMHDLSKTILRHGVSLSIHKLPIYLMCPDKRCSSLPFYQFCSCFYVISIVSACTIPLILGDSTSYYTHSIACNMRAYIWLWPTSWQTHTIISHCSGVAIVELPSRGSQSREA